MKLKLTAVAVAVLVLALPVQSANMAQSLCEYVSIDDKKRFRSSLKANKLKVRMIFKDIKCNDKNLLEFADTKGSLKIAELIISKLPKKTVLAELPKLNNHHLIEAANNRIE